MAFNIAGLLAETEDLLCAGLELAPLPIPPDIARAEGLFKGAPAIIETRAYSGPSVRFARFALIEGRDLEIGNALCLGRAEIPLPIFGADLVAISADAAMLAADLSPVLRGDEGARLLEPLARRRALHAELPAGGELPAWCAAWFSPYALYTRIGPADAPRASAAYLDFPRAFVDTARSSAPAPGRAEAIGRSQRSYLADHRDQDRGLGMLAKMFGAAWAARYIEKALFPQSIAD